MARLNKPRDDLTGDGEMPIVELGQLTLLGDGLGVTRRMLYGFGDSQNGILRHVVGVTRQMLDHGKDAGMGCGG